MVIIFPAQLGTKEDYEELSSDIFEAVQLKSYTAPLTRLDWPVSVLKVTYYRKKEDRRRLF